MENREDLISISEAARIAGTSRNGIYVGIKRGELTKYPARVMLSRQEVERWATREKSKGGRPRKTEPAQPEPPKRRPGRPKKEQ